MSDKSPIAGDLLISRRPSDDHFEISIVPGRPQLTVRLQHEAVAQAQAFAGKNGGTVWMLQGSNYVRLNPPKQKES